MDSHAAAAVPLPSQSPRTGLSRSISTGSTAFTQRQLSFAAGTAPLAEPATFGPWLDTLWRQDWVVYAKPPFAGPQQVVAYLGRYTHRIAISNERLVAIENDMVHFRWRDYRQGNTVKVMVLPAAEFIRRFLLHVLPRGFQRLRHYGVLGNRCRAQTLAACRRALHTHRHRLGPWRRPAP